MGLVWSGLDYDSKRSGREWPSAPSTLEVINKASLYEDVLLSPDECFVEDMSWFERIILHGFRTKRLDCSSAQIKSFSMRREQFAKIPLPTNMETVHVPTAMLETRELEWMWKDNTSWFYTVIRSDDKDNDRITAAHYAYEKDVHSMLLEGMAERTAEGNSEVTSFPGYSCAMYCKLTLNKAIQ